MVMKKTRSALSSHGGPRTGRGNAAVRGAFERALERAATAESDELTHGFHTYPARMHAQVARVLVQAFGAPGARVLDPFCGSGTTLIEASRRGLSATGVDLNPLALRVAEVKCRVTSEEERERFRAALELVVENSRLRVRNRAPARAPLPPAEVRHYQGHVLKELAGLYEEVQAVSTAPERRALEMVLSSMVVKFSRQRADTSDEGVDKRIGRFVPTEFFGRKGQELLRRWEELAAAVPAGTPPVRLLEGDARELPHLVREQRFDLVVSSPPYGGTYDYHAHHARRFPWLRLDDRRLQHGELGARRRLSEEAGGKVRWRQELGAALASISAVITEGALAVLFLGDAEVEGERVPADRQLEELGPGHAFVIEAVVSEERLDRRGGEPRREHLVALRRVVSSVAAG
jgi:SAM-dependent methyltransferase